MSFENLLNSQADMKRPVSDYDDMGSVVYTLSTYSTNHPIRISQAVPTQVSNGPIEWSQATAMIYASSGTDFQRDDEVHHGTTVYEVLGVKTPSVSDHHTTLVCKVKNRGQ